MMTARLTTICCHAALSLAMVSTVIAAPLITNTDESRKSQPHTWIVSLLMNALCYLIIILPLLLLRCYLRRNDRMDLLKQGDDDSHHCLSKFSQLCFVPDVAEVTVDKAAIRQGSASPPDSVTPKSVPHPDSSFTAGCTNRVQRAFGLHLPAEERTTKQRGALLAVCALGLQVFYVMWGIMQERIMTRDYDGVRFQNSQFLVFCNRLFALLVVIPIHLLQLNVACNPFKPGRRAPFFDFAFASISNILSSWCQYEALKYVTFPTQVISKACKVIPVMIMGRFIQGRTYSRLEYITAGFISFGLSLFMLSDPIGYEAHPSHDIQSNLIVFSGLLLIVGYMLMDSFTSNWQDHLFRQYHLSPVQVMVGVNMWSLMLTLSPLIFQGTLISCFQFAFAHPEFSLNVALSATCSAFGQLFIFLTIAQFGPATFALIMTLRMGLSLLLSCLLFSHRLSLGGVVGVCLVFVALFTRIYFRSSKRKSTHTAQPNANSNV